MSLLYRFKPQKDSRIRSIVAQLDNAGVTANEIAALGLCLALGAGLFAYYGHLYAGLTLFAASAVCDALDGSLARATSKGTEFGLYFDGVADRFSELFFVSGAGFGANVRPSAFFVVGELSRYWSRGARAIYTDGAPCPPRLGDLNDWRFL